MWVSVFLKKSGSKMSTESRFSKVTFQKKQVGVNMNVCVTQGKS